MNNQGDNEADQPDFKTDNSDNRNTDACNNGDDDTMLLSNSKRMKKEAETTVGTKRFSRRWLPPYVGRAKCQGRYRSEYQDAHLKCEIDHGPRDGIYRTPGELVDFAREHSWNRAWGPSKTLLVGVLDGHGSDGHVFAQYVAEHLPKLLEKELKLTERYPPERRPSVDAVIPDVKNEPSLTVSTTSVADDEGKSEPQQFLSTQRDLVNAFHQVHEAAIQDRNVPSRDSGSTCIVFILEDERICPRGICGRFACYRY